MDESNKWAAVIATIIMMVATVLFFYNHPFAGMIFSVAGVMGLLRAFGQ